MTKVELLCCDARCKIVCRSTLSTDRCADVGCSKLHCVWEAGIWVCKCTGRSGSPSVDALWCLHWHRRCRLAHFSSKNHCPSWEAGSTEHYVTFVVRAAHGAGGDAAGAYRAPIGFCSSLRSLLPGEGTGAPKARAGAVSVSATGVAGGGGAAPAVHEGLQRDLGGYYG